jgi:hypothetical protein
LVKLGNWRRIASWSFRAYHWRWQSQHLLRWARTELVPFHTWFFHPNHGMQLSFQCHTLMKWFHNSERFLVWGGNIALLETAGEGVETEHSEVADVEKLPSLVILIL